MNVMEQGHLKEGTDRTMRAPGHQKDRCAVAWKIRLTRLGSAINCGSWRAVGARPHLCCLVWRSCGRASPGPWADCRSARRASGAFQHARLQMQRLTLDHGRWRVCDKTPRMS